MEFAAHASVQAIAPADWDACFPGDPEGWAYHRAVEDAGLPGFAVLAFEVRRDGRVVLVAPAFTTEYRLDTTVQGTLKRLLAPFTGLLTLRLLCLGSHAADKCHLGFAPGLGEQARAEALDTLLAGMDAFAAAHGIGLLAVKDLAESDATEAVLAGFKAAGFACQPSLPNAVLALPFADEESYLASLSKATRKDIRRKLKSEAGLRIELRRGAEALDRIDAMLELYERQRARSGVDFEQFEQLNPAYFRNVLTGMGAAALVFFYWAGAELVGFNLCLAGEARFIDKFIGLREPQARAFDLYVVSWMTNLRYCLEHRIPLMQTGQTAYAMKRRLGSALPPNWLLFRHRWRLFDRLLRLLGPLLAPDRWDEDIAP